MDTDADPTLVVYYFGLQHLINHIFYMAVKTKIKGVNIHSTKRIFVAHILNLSSSVR